MTGAAKILTLSFCHVVFIVDRKRDPLSYFSRQREAFQTCHLIFALFIADKWWQQMHLRISGLLSYGCERDPTQPLLQREIHMRQHAMQSKNTVHHTCKSANCSFCKSGCSSSRYILQGNIILKAIPFTLLSVYISSDIFDRKRISLARSGSLPS
jgi:hypothetical protein